MWEQIRKFLNSLQFETDIDQIAEDIIDRIRDTKLSDDIQYDIEMGLYAIMENTTAPKAFIKKAGKFIKKKIDEHIIEFFEEGASYYADDMGDDEDNVEDLDV